MRFAAAVVVVSLVTGCGDDDDDSGEADGTAGVTTVADTSTAVSEAAPADTGGGGTAESVPPATDGSAGTEPAGTDGPDGEASTGPWVTEGVDHEATLKIATFAPMTSADPHAPGANVSTTYWDLFYDRLLWPARNSELTPYLVTDWEFVDGALVLTLRDDATFHDGSPVDATAVKANLDRARTWEKSVYRTQLAAIESIDVVDDGTVRLNLLPNRGATLPYVLAGWAGLMVNPKFLDEAVLSTTAPDGAGSGPYKIVSWTPGESTVVLEATGEHWDPAAGQAARVEVYFPGDAMQAVNAVTAGQDSVNVASGVAGGEAIRQIEAAPDQFQGGWVDTYSTNAIFMSDKVDPVVRQAMSLAMDREAIVALYPEGGATINNQLFPVGHPGHVDEIDEITVYDPDQAREVIATAPEGTTSITMGVASGGVAQQVAQLLQAQFAAVGIEVTLAPGTIPSTFQAWAEGQIDVLLSGTAGPAHTSIGIDEAILRGSNQRAAPDSELPALQAELTRADDPALSEAEKNQIYQDIQIRAAQENWLLVYVMQGNTVFAQSDMTNVLPEVPFQFQSVPNFRYVAKLAS